MDFGYSNEKGVILVVDDQPNNLKVIASVLSTDYTLSIANNGTNALKVLEKLTPDLILLDVMMPDLNGFEVCKIIKDNPAISNIPIIFLTAKTDINDMVKGLECGAVDYITKPFNPTEVRVRVKNHIKFHQANKQLDLSNKQKDKFFSIISHDLRSPFTGIMGLSYMISDKIKKGEFAGIDEYSQLILKASEDYLDLLNNLLNWARAQTDRLEVSPTKIDLKPLLEEVLSIYRENSKQKDISLALSINSDHYLYADIDMVRTILRNLLSNAIKFTHPGGNVFVSCKSNDKSSVIISIIDSGIGMSKEILDGLFEIDRNVNRPGTQGESSSGLGLIICKEFAEKQGGRLTVQSKEGSGTSFSLLLPGMSE